MSNNKQEISCLNAGHWNGFRQETGEDNSVTIIFNHLFESMVIFERTKSSQYANTNIGIHPGDLTEVA